MKTLTDEEKQHFSGKNNHWCIVHYIGGTVFYYEGYFGKGKPAFTADFNDALKCHSRIAANQILLGLKACSGFDCSEYKVEDHAWFGWEAEFDARKEQRPGLEL